MLHECGEGGFTHPFVAVCGRGNGECDSVPLAEADLRPLAFSWDGLVAELRKMFGLTGVVEADEAGFPEARRIGELGRQPVFLALSPGVPGFEAWLAARRNALVMWGHDVLVSEAPWDCQGDSYRGPTGK
jgi:hypothetical protein